MPALTEEQKRRVWRSFIERWIANQADPCEWTKADLAATAAAINDWIDSNATSFNNALPAAFRTTATAQEKAAFFVYVVSLRAGLL